MSPFLLSWPPSLRLSVAVAAFLFAVGCAPVTMPVPPELEEGSEHYSITSSGKAFSRQSELTAGPYRLLIEVDQNEETETQVGATRTTKTQTRKIRLASTEAPGPFIATGNCVDTFAWTKHDGNAFASNVVDEMKCTGTSEGSKWSLHVHRGDGNGYEGVFLENEESTPIRSVHEQALSMKGAIRGYALGVRGETRLAGQKIYSSQPGELWIKKDANVSPNQIAALLSLLLFDENK